MDFSQDFDHFPTLALEAFYCCLSMSHSLRDDKQPRLRQSFSKVHLMDYKARVRSGASEREVMLAPPGWDNCMQAVCGTFGVCIQTSLVHHLGPHLWYEVYIGLLTSCIHHLLLLILIVLISGGGLFPFWCCDKTFWPKAAYGVISIYRLWDYFNLQIVVYYWGKSSRNPSNNLKQPPWRSPACWLAYRQAWAHDLLAFLYRQGPAV